MYGMLFSEPFGERFIFVRMSLIKVYINMIMSIRFFLSHDILARTDTPLDTLSTGFLQCRVSGYIRQ